MARLILVYNLVNVPTLSLLLLCQLQVVLCQVPTICATNANLRDRRCCPNNCNLEKGYGRCVDVRGMANDQYRNADQNVVNILSTSHQQPHKNYSIDSRYLWPTMVFHEVCMCNDNRYGPDCTDCAFGYKLNALGVCVKKDPVTRRSFWSLSDSERKRVMRGIQILKTEMGNWSVIVSEESPRYQRDRVEVQNVSFYNYLVYIHNYVAREASNSCVTLNHRTIIDFAHSGPNFLVWHRTFLLILERAMQIVLEDEDFGFPYWDWERDSESPFKKEYFGRQISPQRGNYENVFGDYLRNWNTVCDIGYTPGQLSQPYVKDNDPALCKKYWAPCNPENDLINGNILQRGFKEAYLPNLREIQMVLTSTEYDVMKNSDKSGLKDSFRSTLEGWNTICSGSNCISDFDVRDEMLENRHMHNVVHLWVGGHMRIPASAVNDPIFSLHHTNIDRILESWKTTNGSTSVYYPISGGHPGHNRDDFMVPFFPLITPGDQYDGNATNWGYMYDELVPASISSVKTCTRYDSQNIKQCQILRADGTPTCFDRSQENTEEIKYEYGMCERDTGTGSSSTKLGANYPHALLITSLVILTMSKV